MWKRGGRSSALDRAQALLSGKRSSGGDAESTRGSTAKTPMHTVSYINPRVFITSSIILSDVLTRPHMLLPSPQGAVGGYVKPRSAPPNTHTLLSDLSDLSSVSSASEHGVMGSADTENHQRRDGGATKVNNLWLKRQTLLQWDIWESCKVSLLWCCLSPPCFPLLGSQTAELSGRRREQVFEEGSTTCNKQQPVTCPQEPNAAGAWTQVCFCGCKRNTFYWAHDLKKWTPDSTGNIPYSDIHFCCWNLYLVFSPSFLRLCSGMCRLPSVAPRLLL